MDALQQPSRGVASQQDYGEVEGARAAFAIKRGRRGSTAGQPGSKQSQPAAPAGPSVQATPVSNNAAAHLTQGELFKPYFKYNFRSIIMVFIPSNDDHEPAARLIQVDLSKHHRSHLQQL